MIQLSRIRVVPYRIRQPVTIASAAILGFAALMSASPSLAQPPKAFRVISDESDPAQPTDSFTISD